MDICSKTGHLDVLEETRPILDDILKDPWFFDGFLFMPLKYGHVNILEFVYVQMGIDIGWQLQADWAGSVYHKACTFGHVPVVHWLLSKFSGQFDVMEVGMGGNCLQLAASRGHFEMLKYFYDSHCNDKQFFVKSSAGWSLLHEASCNGHLDIVQWLVDKFGSDKWTKPQIFYSHSRENSFHLAAKYGHLDVIQYLDREFGHHGLFDVTDDQKSLVNFAAEDGHFEIVQWALDNYPDKWNLLMVRQQTKRHVLHDATVGGNLAVLKYFNGHVQSPDRFCKDKDTDGCTLVHLAAKHGHYNILNWLLDEFPDGFDLTAKTSTGDNILHLASQGGYLATLKLLYSKLNNEKKQMFFEAGHRNYTVLNIAILRNHLSIVKWLRQTFPKGTFDLSKENWPEFRANAVYFAIIRDFMDMVKYLYKWQGDQVDFFALCCNGKPEELEHQIKAYHVNDRSRKWMQNTFPEKFKKYAEKKIY